MDINFSLISEGLANTYGDKEILVNVEKNRRYTYREYHKLTNQIVNMMTGKLGLTKNDRYSLILKNDNLSLLHFFTALKGAASAAYCNYVDPAGTQIEQIDAVNPSVTFIESDLVESHHAELTRRNIKIVCMDKPEVDPGFPGVSYFWELLEGVSDENPNIIHDDRDDCLIMRYTGGTTGKSKCVMYSLDNWMANKDLHLSIFDKMPADGGRQLHMAPISHASGAVILPCMFSGGCIVTMNVRCMMKWCHWVQQEKATQSLLLPTLLYALMVSPNVKDYDLSSLETLYYGGSTMCPTKLKELRTLFKDTDFVQIYGSSEHVGWVTSLGGADHNMDDEKCVARIVTAGRVVPGVELKIVRSNGNQANIGEIGEIWIRSRAICMGYLDNPEKTKEEFVDGFWKSGDAGKIDEDGYVSVIDRMKDKIETVHGTVYPTAIEAALNANLNVYASAVVGSPQDDGSELVHADVILNPDDDITEADLIQFAREGLEADRVPSSITFVKCMPTSPVGKVLRNEVKNRHIELTQQETA